jgi:nucleoid-associated protein EbfC
MGTGFSKKKKQAKQLQEQFAKMQEEMKNTEVEGQAGNGLVKVKLNGECKLTGITINPECVDPEDVEGLEDLIKAAYDDAAAQLEKSSGSMPGAGGMPSMPGMPDLSSLGLPF